MKIMLNAFATQAGPVVAGPGKVSQQVYLLARAAENDGVFATAADAGGLSLANVLPAFAGQFQLGKEYVITVEEKPAS